MGDGIHAYVLGGSGSVGQALLQELISNNAVAEIVAFNRSHLSDLALTAASKLREIFVPEMKAEALAARVMQTASADKATSIVGFSTLGVGAKTAKLTIDEHRAVDVVLNQAFARGLQKSGKSTHLVFMSAVGANHLANALGSGAAGLSRYNRVKGESEEAVKNTGLSCVSVVRPAMIIGSRHTPILAEKILSALDFFFPGRLKSIRTDEIAKAMVQLGLCQPSQSMVYHYPEMQKLIAASKAVAG